MGIIRGFLEVTKQTYEVKRASKQGFLTLNPETQGLKPTNQPGHPNTLIGSVPHFSGGRVMFFAPRRCDVLWDM